MQTGNRFRAYPTPAQESILLQWIGHQRFIYNAKVSEDRYYRTFAKKAVSLSGTPIPVDQEYARFIGESTPWLNIRKSAALTDELGLPIVRGEGGVPLSRLDRDVK